MKLKPNTIFKGTLVLLIVVFIALYVSQVTGYYAYSNYERVILTKENIAKFEQDVKEGKEIDVNNYVLEEGNYENKLSKFSLQVSNTIGKYVKKGIVGFFKKINKLIE